MNLLADACSPFICSELEEALVKQSGKGFNYIELSEVIRDYDIDTNNNVIDTIAVANNPRGIEFNPANNNIYIGSWGSSIVTVIDANNNWVDDITVPGPINSDLVLEFNPINNNIYAANIGSNTVTVIDSNNNVMDNIVVGNNPRY